MFQQWYQRVRGEGTGGSLEAGHSVAENLTILWKLCVCVGGGGGGRGIHLIHTPYEHEEIH